LLAHTQQGEILYYGDGIGGFITVKRHINPLGDYYYKLLISGKTDASSHGDMKTQTLSGHFPLLFHHDPKKVMVVGLASGVTAGEALNYPIEQLDVLEINEQVVTASDYFRPWNSNVLSDDRTNIIVQDGRAHLQLTNQKYDVIISEPSNPWMAGLASLFTKDFFELAQDRLNEQGIYLQWLQTYQIDWETVKLIGRTFAEVFPNSIMLATEPSGFGADYLLVGFKDENIVSIQNAERNFAYAKKSKNIKLNDFRLFYRLIVAENLKELFGTGPVNSDVHPILEFSAPKLIYHTDTTIARKIRSEGALSEETRNIVKQLYSNVDLQIDFAEYAFSVNSPYKNMIDIANASPKQKERFYKLFEEYSKMDIIDYVLLRDPELRKRCMAAQIKKITESIDSMPDKAAEYKFLGELYLKNGMLEQAEKNYLLSLDINPEDAETNYNLGIVYAQKGSIDQAKKVFGQAVALSSHYAGITLKIIGIALSSQGEMQQAADVFQEYLEIQPDDFQIHNQLGVIYLEMGNIDLAIKYFSQALKINSEFEVALQNLKAARSRKASQ
jgi:spermidine synthase